MHTKKISFTKQETAFYFDASVHMLPQIAPKEHTILLIDENVWKHHHKLFEGYRLVPMPAGEEYKNHQAVADTIEELIKLEACRNTMLVGIGGGVVTDVTGFIASIFLRGVSFGFIPTTILAMVDAAIGGKNGIDIGLHKNMAGTVNQPSFILYDYSLLQSLPHEEWINGFAEIIKHACIKDKAMFTELTENSIEIYQNETAMLAALIEKNAEIKTAVVLHDEFEKGERKLLNFGHTIGHAIENLHQLPHGHAVSLGMMAAAAISEEINNFSSAEKEKLKNLLLQYELPVSYKYDKSKAWQLLKSDKKRQDDSIHFILLNNIGNGVIIPISLTQLEDLFIQIL